MKSKHQSKCYLPKRKKKVYLHQKFENGIQASSVANRGAHETCIKLEKKDVITLIDMDHVESLLMAGQDCKRTEADHKSQLNSETASGLYKQTTNIICSILKREGSSEP